MLEMRKKGFDSWRKNLHYPHHRINERDRLLNVKCRFIEAVACRNAIGIDTWPTGTLETRFFLSGHTSRMGVRER